MALLLCFPNANVLADPKDNQEAQPSEQIELKTYQQLLDEADREIPSKRAGLAVKKDKQERCRFHPNGDEWVDGMRRSSHGGLCRTALWLDGLFGDEKEFNDRDFRGKVSLGFRQDEVDGFDPRLRVRLRTKLPNVSSRLNAFVGKVEEDSFVSNTEVDENRINTVGLRSSRRDNDQWLIGLGYRDPKDTDKGFDYSVGAKLSSGINPYVKVSHRYLLPTSELSYWRTKQTVFWRRDEKFGVSSKLDYTKVLNRKDILQWDTDVKYTQAAEQWEWVSSASWHHSFTNDIGISTRAYLRGEEKNAHSIPEYGINFTYIQPFLRPWLFVETGFNFRWEKLLPSDTAYERSVRFGLQFEMLLGDYYGHGDY